MSITPEQLHTRLNRTTSKYALYFSLDDNHRHSDAPSFISLITDLSLMELARELLPIVGHHLVERSTDFVLDRTIGHATRLFNRIISYFGSNSQEKEAPKASGEIDEIVGLLVDALRAASVDERDKVLSVGTAAVAKLTKAQFKLSDTKAQEYAVAFTTEIRVTIGGS